MIHVALVSAHPTETDARAAIAEALHTIALGQFRGTPYRGIWRAPQGYGGLCHVFTRQAVADLENAGWTREDAP